MDEEKNSWIEEDLRNLPNLFVCFDLQIGSK